MSRLPQPGGDDNIWGDLLNDFLAVEHNADGTLKNVARPSDLIPKLDKAGGIMTGSLTLASDPSNNLQAATKQYADGTASTAETNAKNYTDSKFPVDAVSVTFDDTGLTNITHTNVQDALTDLDAAVAAGGGGSSDAIDINYDNSSSGLTAVNVQGAIDELKTDVDNAGSGGGTTVVAGNDNFADAYDLGSDYSGEVTFDNTGATLEASEPGLADGNTVWFKWTSPEDGTYSFDTAATPLPVWDSAMAVYTGASVGALTQIATDDDGLFQVDAPTDAQYGSSRTIFQATKDTTYYLQIAAWDGTTNGETDVGPGTRTDAVLRWKSGAVASTVSYDNSSSALSATTVQGAIDEVVEDIQQSSQKLVPVVLTGSLPAGSGTGATTDLVIAGSLIPDWVVPAGLVAPGSTLRALTFRADAAVQGNVFIQTSRIDGTTGTEAQWINGNSPNLNLRTLGSHSAGSVSIPSNFTDGLPLNPGDIINFTLVVSSDQVVNANFVVVAYFG